MASFSQHRKNCPQSSHQQFLLRQSVLAIITAFGCQGIGATDFKVVPAGELPKGGQVVAGQATMTSAGTTMNIQQTTPKLITNWQSFNIGSDATVNFQQPNASSTALNRIVGQDPTQIYGRLNANGQVFLINPNGMLFGRNASVNVGGLTASTLNISDENFLSGKYIFERGGAMGKIENLGTLTAAEAGHLALLAPEVRNEGALVANMGVVALAGGDKVTLEFNGNRLINVAVDPATIETLIENKNLVDVGGGQVIISTAAANQLLGATISNSGQISANSVSNEGGRIFLKGDSIKTGGTINASGKTAGGSVQLIGGDASINGRIEANSNETGGEIQIKTVNDLVVAGVISANSTDAAGGRVALESARQLYIPVNGHIQADGAAGGSITALGADDAIISGKLSAIGTSSDGGLVAVSSKNVALLGANLTASGDQAGGTVLVGGEWQGGKGATALPRIKNAETLYVSSDTNTSVTGNYGKGGKAVFWSDLQTRFSGNVFAQSNSFGGGQVEVSSKNDLFFAGHVNAGTSGWLLLDPKNIFIEAEGGGLSDAAAKLYTFTSSLNHADSIALSQTGWMAIGDATGASNKGSVNLYSTTSTGFEDAVLRYVIPGEAINDEFGKSVALSNTATNRFDGNYAAPVVPFLVGAPSASTTDGAKAGKFYVYALNLPPSGPIVAQVLPSPLAVIDKDFFGFSQPGDRLGASVAVQMVGTGLEPVIAVGTENRNQPNGSGTVSVGQLNDRKMVYRSNVTPDSIGDGGNFAGAGIGAAISMSETGRLAAAEATSVPNDKVYIFSINNDGTRLGIDPVLLSAPNGLSNGWGAIVALSPDGRWLLAGNTVADGSRPYHTSNRLYVYQFDSPSSNNGSLRSDVITPAGNFKGAAFFGNDTFALLDESINSANAEFWRLTTANPWQFSSLPADNITFGASKIAATLSQGTAVTLQANNDIQVNAAILANNLGGNGGDLTLQAGRSVLVNASITTDNGNLTIVANETNPNGVVASNRDAGSANITMANGTHFNAGSGRVSVTLADGGGRSGTAAQSGDIRLASITAGNLAVVNNGPSAGNVVLQSGAAIQISGADNAAVLAAASGGNFRNEGATLSTPAGRWLIYSNDPDQNSFGGLVSGNLPLWNRTYAGDSAAGVPETGNRFLFSRQPTLTVTYGGATGEVVRQYSGDFIKAADVAGSASGSSSVIGDINDGYGGAFLASRQGDGTLQAGVLSGGNVTIGGVGDESYRNVGSYSIDYSVDGATVPTSPTGYRVVSSGSGSGKLTLSITPAPLTVSTQDVIKTYDATTGTTGPSVSQGPNPVAVNGTQLMGTDTLSGGDYVFDTRHVSIQNSTVQQNKAVKVANVTVNDGNGGKNYAVTYSDNQSSRIDPAMLVVTASDAQKVYDGSTSASASLTAVGGTSLFGADNVSGGSFVYDNKNAGKNKAVNVVDAASIVVNDGNSGGNYFLSYQQSSSGSILPAPLQISMVETQCRAEDDHSSYEYVFSGFVSGESLSSVAVSGTPQFSVPTTALQLGAQTVSLTGAGDLSAQNYSPVIGAQPTATVNVIPGSATTYQLTSQSDLALKDNSPPETAKVASDFVADKANNARFVSLASAKSSGVVGNGRALATYVGARYAERQERFSDAVNQLETNPALADLAQCQPGDAPETLCIPPLATPQFGSNPSAEIRRKVAYFFANQAYGPAVGVLGTPYSDADAIAKILQDQYGYEVHVIRDATRRDMVLALKQAVEAHARDESVLIYYAGHGVEVRDQQSGDMMGYWIPVDGNHHNPRTWLSNTDIGKFMQLVQSKQVMLVSDSCFSGRLATEQQLEKGSVDTRRVELLSKRAVTVMSSGNFEEVDDAGKGNHSIFAWSLIDHLNKAAGTTRLIEGNQLFKDVKRSVHAEGFPQTPQYSALLSAGYEKGGEFFLEKR